MSLTPGKTLGSFEILGLLGVGGMGEVYRARDPKLGREVAIKVLPEAVEKDAQGLIRFEREAQVLAALSHSNIAAIHGLEASGGTHFLVMELVEGPTLEEWIEARPTLSETLEVFAQIAEGLAYAHARGIVHRDLKPANVKITNEGAVKLLDFGLAKLLDVPQAESAKGDTLDLSEPAKPVTEEGRILGTPLYMSPEQIRAQEVDARTDVWAFGCCLFEALTSRRAFAANSFAETVGAVLERQPDWTLLPSATPAAVRTLIRRCLEKNSRARLQDIGDARVEIEEAIRGSQDPALLPDAAVPNQAKIQRTVGIVLLVIGLLGGGFLGSNLSRKNGHGAPTPSAPSRSAIFEIPAPASEFPVRIEMPAISPDGRRIVYVGSVQATRLLYVRDIGDLRSIPLAGTDDASGPFFSPDGEWIGFFDGPQGKMKKISAHGGRPIVLCDAQVPLGGFWTGNDTILFTPTTNSGIWRVSASGGEPEPLTQLNEEKGELIHAFPDPLPDGNSLLVTTSNGSLNDSHTSIISLSTGESRLILEHGTLARYVPTGHIVYFIGDELYAVPFDPISKELTGPAIAIVHAMGMNPMLVGIFDLVQYSFSDDGTLAYMPKPEPSRELVWVDREGLETELPLGRRAFRHPRISPDGHLLAVAIEEVGGAHIWIHDFARGTFEKVTTGGSNMAPVWAPDGKSILFSSSSQGILNLYKLDIDGGGEPEEILASDRMQTAGSWNGANGDLLFCEYVVTNGDIWAYDAGAPGTEAKRRPLIVSASDENKPDFSPDGRFFAYDSNISGTFEIYVRPYPDFEERRWIVSAGNSGEPVWARDGKRLFYREGKRMMEVDVETQAEFKAGPPREIFQGEYWALDLNRSFDVSPDGSRFLMMKQIDDPAGRSNLTVVLNWFEQIKERAPAAADGPQ